MLSMLVEVVDNVGDREHQRILDASLEAQPLLGVGVPIEEVIKDLCTQQWWESHRSHRSVCAGRGLWVKVNLPIFKDEKSKDAVTYHSWWWDVAIFHQSGWDDQHLLPYIFHSLQGFPGDLARSLCDDATLSDILQMLNEHCGVVMMFNALSKELYSLKQGWSKKITEFGVRLSQQVKILQSEYPGRIHPEHMEEMKHDHFYEGLNLEYQQMLAHKVDGEHQASYSNLLLARQKLERRAKARDPLPQKMALTSGNKHDAFPQASEFPSCKLKDNHTFATWAAAVGNDEAEEVSSVKQEEGEGEMEPSAEKDVEVSDGVGEMDQTVEYIIYFAKVVELYQMKNKNCFGCGSTDHIIWNFPKDVSKSAQKAYFNMKEGMAKKGGWAPQKPAAAQWASLDEVPQA